MAQMNPSTKQKQAHRQKQIHRHRDQTCGDHEGVGEGWSGSLGLADAN